MKDSPQWAFLKRFMVADPDTGLVYLDRLRIIETPWFGIYFHRILMPDFGRHLHDHPWPFISILLKGTYEECTKRLTLMDRVGPIAGVTTYEWTRVVKWINVKKSTDAHRIVRIDGAPVWSLVLRGPRTRKWGFYTEDGWVPYDEYEKVGVVQ